MIVVNNAFSTSHNPYFNRWFSAMKINISKQTVDTVSQSLF